MSKKCNMPIEEALSTLNRTRNKVVGKTIIPTGSQGLKVLAATDCLVNYHGYNRGIKGIKRG